MSNEKPLALNQLPPEIKTIIKTKKIETKKRLSQWLVLLRILSKFDSETDVLQKVAFNKVMSSAIILFISIFFLIFGLAFSEGNLIVAAIVCPVPLVAIIRLIIYIVKSSRLKKVDLDNDFRETLLPLFELLSEDIQPKGKILLDLNMSNLSDKQFKTGQTKLPPGRFKKLTETTYEMHCCNASIPLVDGTLLTLDITKKLAAYDRSYRSSSGKYKTKRKWKLLTLVTTALTPNEKTLAVSEAEIQMLSASEKVKLAEKKGVQLCKLTRKFKFRDPIGGIPEDCIPPEAVIEMYMKLCSTLNPKVA